MSTSSSTQSATNQNALRISRAMRVSDILTLLPDAAPQLAEYGLHCFSCAANAYETLEDGCATHGFSSQDIDDLVTDLNILLSGRPERPHSISITEAAARGLKGILEEEGKSGWGLKVTLDDGGGFCMEFAEQAAADEKVFCNEAVPDIPVFASSMTLMGIGGATIDLRDGRFKLDLPTEKKNHGCGCKDGGQCACKNGGSCACSK